MGTFSNGSECEAYHAKYCYQCIQYVDHHCPCMDAHFEHNDSECNKPDSILHKMIPMNEDLSNGECVFFKRKGGE